MSFLIRFNKPSNLNQDYPEIISKTCLTFLQLSCGKEVSVTVADKIRFSTEPQLHVITRIALGVLAAATFPLIIIGLIFQNCSTTYENTLEEYMKDPSVIQSSDASTSGSILSRISTVIPQVFTSTNSSNNQSTASLNHSSASTSVRKLTKPVQPLITPDQIYAQLGKLQEEWNTNFIENFLVPILHSNGTPDIVQEMNTHPIIISPPQRMDEKQFNEQIFAYVKDKTGVRTPNDIVWSWNPECSIYRPTPITTRERDFQLEEGCFYDFRGWGENPIQKTTRPTDRYFGAVMQYTNGKIHLYLDGSSYISFLRINNNLYPYKEGFGLSKPMHTFAPGDRCFNNQCLLFGISDREEDKDKLIYYVDDKRIFPTISKAAEQQFYDFEKAYDSKIRSQAKIDAHEKLEPGFAIHSSGIDVDKIGELTFQELIPAEGDLTFIDLENDPVLRDILHYFKAEFNLIKYTPQQKLMRISSFVSTAIAAISPYSSPLSAINYNLGNILLAGKGLCRHRSFLIKVLTDHLDIPCGLICAKIHKPTPFYNKDNKAIGHINFQQAHVWNEFVDDSGHTWILDSMSQTCFKIGEPPGYSEKYKEEIRRVFNH